tara:strand:+ start:475 stop:669 length:195 start_codon:yes stop_codon:yes gene_type:complete
MKRSYSKEDMTAVLQLEKLAKKNMKKKSSSNDGKNFDCMSHDLYVTIENPFIMGQSSFCPISSS